MFAKNVSARPLKKISSWRRISLAAWGRPQDPSVYGLQMVDMTAGLRLLDQLARQPGPKITLTHLVIKAIAQILNLFPELNVLIRSGRLYQRADVDVFVQVSLEEQGKADLSGAKIRNAQQKSLAKIAQELASQSQKIRAGKDPNLKQTKRSLQFLPPKLLKWSLRFLEWLSYDLNIRPSFLKLPSDPFGAVMVTNVGMFGLKMGWAPLVPFSRSPIVLLLGEVTDQPVAQAGQVVIKPMLNIGVTVDHRIIDGYLAGKAAAEFKRLLENPDEMV